MFDELAQDTEAQEQWQRYHLIGDVMRGEGSPVFGVDLSARIAEAIELEPVVVSPHFANRNNVANSRVMVPGTSRIVHFVRNAGQYAIAASVAVAAIFGVQQYQLVMATNTAPVSVLNTIPISGSVAPVSLQSQSMTHEMQSQELTDEQLLEKRKRITAYLQDHALQQRTIN